MMQRPPLKSPPHHGAGGSFFFIIVVDIILIYVYNGKSRVFEGRHCSFQKEVNDMNTAGISPSFSFDRHEFIALLRVYVCAECARWGADIYDKWGILLER